MTLAPNTQFLLSSLGAKGFHYPIDNTAYFSPVPIHIASRAFYLEEHKRIALKLTLAQLLALRETGVPLVNNTIWIEHEDPNRLRE